MSTSNPSPKNGIVSTATAEQYITGPHWEPPSIPNATTDWRCTNCTRESIREEDLYRETFHSEDCEVRKC